MVATTDARVLKAEKARLLFASARGHSDLGSYAEAATAAMHGCALVRAYRLSFFVPRAQQYLVALLAQSGSDNVPAARGAALSFAKVLGDVPIRADVPLVAGLRREPNEVTKRPPPGEIVMSWVRTGVYALTGVQVERLTQEIAVDFLRLEAEQAERRAIRPAKASVTAVTSALDRFKAAKRIVPKARKKTRTSRT